MCPHAVVRTQLQIRAIGAANKQDLGRCVFRENAAGQLKYAYDLIMAGSVG